MDEQVADADTPEPSETLWSRGSSEDTIGEEQNTEQETDNPTQADDGEGIQQDSLEAEEPAGPETEDSEVPAGEPGDSPEEESQASDDEGRFEFWQSKYDKGVSKLGFQPDEVTEEEAEFYKTLHQNPEFRQEFLQWASGSGNGQQPAEGQQATSDQGAAEKPQPPEKPDRPAGYSEFDAYNDPESESWQYRKAKESYQEELIEYQNQQIEQFRQEQQQKAEQLQQRQQQEKQQREWRGYLQNEHGFTGEQVEGFFEFARKQQYDPESLVRMYKAYAGIGRQKAKQREKERQLQERKERKEKHPPSPASAGGSGKPGQGTKGDDPTEQVFGRF